MDSVASIVNYRTIESNKVTSIETIVKPKVDVLQAEKIMESCVDLIDAPKYRPFFFKRLYVIGPAKFMELADHARKYGKQPSRLFVKMLREV